MTEITDPPVSDVLGGADQRQAHRLSTLADATEASGAPDGPAGPRSKSWPRRHRRWLYGGGAVVLAAAGLGVWLGTSGGTTAGTGVTFTTAVVSVTTGTMKQTVAASGTIEPAQESALNFAVSGTVTAVNVTAGQAVTAGEVLASVGTTALAAQEAAAQAALTSAQSKLTTDEDDDASTSQLASDRASVTSAKDQLTTAEKDLAGANLTSPIAGVVASVDLTVGEQVAGGGHGGGTSSDSSSSQVEVVSADTYIVNSSVDDTEVGEIKNGDQAVITPTGAKTPVYGTVASVGEIASGSSTVASFPVVVDITGTPSGVYAGASANVSIVVKQLNDVVEVPSGAISYDNGHAEVVLVDRGGQHVTHAVTTGTAETGETQITKGLSAGQKIVEREATFTGAGGKSPAGRGGFPGGTGFRISGVPGGAASGTGSRTFQFKTGSTGG